MAPPPNRPPYEGIKGQLLRHGSKDGRRQTATPAVDVTGVPSTDPGHRSATPATVAVLWAFNVARGKLAPPPLLSRRHQPSEHTSPWGRGLAMSRALRGGALRMRGRSRTSLLWGPGLPRVPGPSSVHARTPTRGSGTVPRHYYRWDSAGRRAQSSQGQGRSPGRQRRAPPSHSTLSTVFDHYTRDSGEDHDFRAPTLMYAAPPYNYKRRGWASFWRG